MNKKTRYILSVAGVISSVIGIFSAIPSFLQNRLGVAIGSAFLIIFGLVLLAISFGDE